MFGLFKKKSVHRHEDLESQMEFLLTMQIGLLRRFDISEDEMAKVIEDEKFISELYLNRLVKLLKEKGLQ